MNSDVKINLNDLESEKHTVIMTYERLLDEFSQLKELLERVEWYDRQYDELIESLNIIASKLSEAIHKLTNGDDVYAIDEVIYYAERYLENERNFPRI